MSDVIKFDFNVPVEAALRFTAPKVFPSNFEQGDDRHMYSTTDGRVMYVTPLTSARIQGAAAGAGRVLLDLQAQERPPDGVRRLARAHGLRAFAACNRSAAARAFQNQAAGDASTRPRLLTSPAPSPTLEEQDPRLARHASNAARPGMSRRRNARGQRQRPRRGRPFRRNRLRGLPPPSASRPRLPSSARAWLLEVNALVDVYAAAALEAASQNVTGTLVKSDDVRSLLVTAYISASKQGARNAA